MDIRTQLDAYFTQHQDEILQDIATLVAIPSVNGAPEEGKPFGAAPYACLEKAVEMAQAYGFKTTVYGGCVVAIDMGGTKPCLDILTHLDVVPAGEGWTVTKPFEMKIVGDRIYGRGTIDDKGPGVMALWAMRAVQELGLCPDHRVRLIMGTDEECGSHDLDVYYAQEAEAPMSFSPDGNYPLINIEKCGIHPQFHGTFQEAASLPMVVALESGTVFNVVPPKAKATIAGMSAQEIEKIVETLGLSGVTVTADVADDSRVDIFVAGVATHVSMPENGDNALCKLLALVAALPLADGAGHTALRTLHKIFPHGDVYGKAAGIAQEDEHGALTLSLVILRYAPAQLTGCLDVRAAVSSTTESTVVPLRQGLEAGGLRLDDCTIEPAHKVEESSPLVQTLLKIYEEQTGIKGKPLCIGGATYVHRLKNGVAFGCMNQDENYHLHDVDEYATISGMMDSGKMFAQAMIALK